MILQHTANFVNIDFRLIVLGFHLRNGIPSLLENSEESFILRFRGKSLQFDDQIGDHITDFPQILCPNALQRRLGEICDFLLAGCTVLQNDSGIPKIDRFGKFLYHLFLFLCKITLIHLRITLGDGDRRLLLRL